MKKMSIKFIHIRRLKKFQGLQCWVKNFISIRHVESSIEAIDNDQEATAGALHAADQYHNDVTVGVDVESMGNAIVDLAHTENLLHHADDHFDRC